jgi:two-component system chemotaxis response regulator CheY
MYFFKGIVTVMRILIAEDDLISRTIMKKYLSHFGECDVAVDGEEAVNLFRIAMAEDRPYSLVTLDIMMPKINGQNVLKEIRDIEAARNIFGSDSVKVIMTTALSDKTNVLSAFRSQCEAYLIKPVEKGKLVAELKKLGLVRDEPA